MAQGNGDLPRNRATGPEASGDFVGRLEEMARLRRALDGAITGAGRVVMLVGEPGAGKTRTAEELTRHAQSRGVHVLWGRVHEESGAPPYWPWVQVIRGYAALRTPEDLGAEMGEAAGVLARIVPELRARLADLPEPRPLGDAEAERFRLFDSLTTFLKSAAAVVPLLLVLDNLHWADESSLKLLELVAHEIGGSRILILGTYRDVELSRGHPLSRTLGDLTREHLFERVHLRGLEQADVGRLLALVAVSEPPAALAATVHAHTEGNPLFVTEVIRLLAEEGKLAPGELAQYETWSPRIPEGVREVIGRRLDRLSEGCNRLLRTAAVVGREFGADVVARLAEGVAEPGVSTALEPALAARLVEEVPGTLGRYRFTHKLVQDTLADEVSTTARVRLHARIVEALEGLYGEKVEEHAAELAGHCAEAHLVLGTEKLVRYSLVAGNRADEAGAWEEAYAIYRRAIDAKGEETMDDELAELYVCISMVGYLSWHMEGSLRRCTRLFDRYQAKGDVSGCIEAYDALGLAVVFGRRGERVDTREYARRTLGPAGSAKVTDPRLLARLADVRFDVDGDFGGMEKEVLRALRLAEQKKDDRVRRDILMRWAQILCALGRARASLDFYAQADAVAVQGASPFESVLRLSGAPLLYLGDLDGARAQADAYAQLAERLRMPRWRASASMQRQCIANATGDWQTARDACARALEILGSPDRPAPEVYWLLARAALVEHELGGAVAGDAYLERFVEYVRDPRTPPIIDKMVSETAVFPLVARITGSARWLDLAARASEEGRPEFGIARGPEDLVNLGLVAVVRGDAQEAGRLHAELLRCQEDLADWVARSAGLMALAAGEIDTALAHFDRSYAFTRDAGYRPEHAWCCCDQADALLARGGDTDPQRAQLLLEEGRSLAHELGMKPLEQRILGRIAKLSPSLAPLYPDGLTGREVEVMRLIARGMSNQEIGYELGISVKTVATHISHVFEKTGVANRAEAATYGLRKGLIQTEGTAKGP